MLQAPLAEEAPIVPEEVQELDDTVGELSTSLASYCTESTGREDKYPVYCPELGLAIEPLKPGYSLASLWPVIPPAKTAPSPSNA